MNEPSPSSNSRSSIEAPVFGCLVGGCGVPVIWLFLSAITVGGGASGWFGLPVIALIFAPVGLVGGLLFNAWKNRHISLSNAGLEAELRSMSLESLLEYKGLCPPDSREYLFAEAELARRRPDLDKPDSNDRDA